MWTPTGLGIGSETLPGVICASLSRSSGRISAGRTQPRSPPACALDATDTAAPAPRSRHRCAGSRPAPARRAAPAPAGPASRPAAGFSESASCSSALPDRASLSARSTWSWVTATRGRTSLPTTFAQAIWPLICARSACTSILRSPSAFLKESTSRWLRSASAWSALSTSSSVTLSFSRAASWSWSFSSMKPRSTCCTRRARVSGSDGSPLAAATRPSRSFRSCVVMTSLLTTAAIRWTLPWAAACLAARASVSARTSRNAGRRRGLGRTEAAKVELSPHQAAQDGSPATVERARHHGWGRASLPIIEAGLVCHRRLARQIARR